MMKALGVKLDSKNWARILSPAVWAMLFSGIGIIWSIVTLEKSEGWSLLIVMALAPVFIGSLLVDIALKYVVKLRTEFIWLIEIGLLTILFVLWIGLFI